MNLYVTTDELKTYLGISGTAKDALLAMLNKQATSMVNGILQSEDLSIHKITNEIHDAVGQYLELYEKRIVAIGSIMDDDIEYTQDNDYDVLSNRIRLDNYLSGGERKAKVTYVAGYYASGSAKIVISDYANIAASATITLGAKNNDGFTITRGVDWVAGVSNNAEADNIATIIDAKQGTRAFSLGSTVYVIEDTNLQVTERTIATSDSARLSLSGSTLGGIDFPESIRLAVMMQVGNLINTGRNPRIKSYTIGSKTVSFASDAEFNQFRDLLKPYMKVGIVAI